MCKSIPGNQKHLTLDDRIITEKGLDNGLSLRSIATKLCKDPSTIAKEIKKHKFIQNHSSVLWSANHCTLLRDCTRKHVCGSYAPVRNKLCKKM